jgi:hypothetical protein
VEEAKKKYGEVPLSFAKSLWDATIEENILVVCKTPMARSITKRTLAGFRSVRVNAQYYKDLIKNISERPEAVVNTFRDGKHFWKINDNTNMKLDAIVGNPPYQVMDRGDCTSSTAIYPRFIDISCKLNPKYVSLITPSRWMTKQGRGLSEEWAEEALNSNHFMYIRDYLNASECFPGVEIKGGICFFLFSTSYNGKCHYVILQNGDLTSKICYLNEWGMVIRDGKAESILNKVSHVEGNNYWELYTCWQ